MPAGKSKAPKLIQSRLKLLGEGSFGCVVSHPLECSGREVVISAKQRHNVKQVSKLFYDKEKYENEVQLGKLVKKIDPSEKKILVPIKGCEISRNTIQKPANINAISKCENLASMTSTKNISKSPIYDTDLALNKVWQLTMPYAGKEFDTSLKKYKNPIPVRSLAKMLIPLFEALVLLKERNMVHQDIKNANVLIQNRKAILIDYSLMLPFDKIYQEDNYNRLKRRYRPFPPEYYMASIIMKHKNDFKHMKSTDVKISIIERYKNHLENIQHYFAPYYSLNELYELSNYGSLMVLALSNYKKFVEFTDKIDVFSVGTMLTDSYDLIATPFSNYDYIMLMRGILHPDPRQRMSAEDALALCKKIASGI